MLLVVVVVGLVGPYDAPEDRYRNADLILKRVLNRLCEFILEQPWLVCRVDQRRKKR